MGKLYVVIWKEPKKTSVSYVGPMSKEHADIAAERWNKDGNFRHWVAEVGKNGEFPKAQK